MRLQLYVLRQLAGSLAFAVAGLSVIVLPTIAIQAVNKLGAISAGTVARYLPLVVAELVPYLMPMAFLLAVVATYGRLEAERELIAVKMAGVHPARLALPGLLLALPLALGTDYLLGEISPQLKYHQRNLLRDADVKRFVAGMNGRTILPFGKNVLRSDSVHGNVRSNVVLEMGQASGTPVRIVAAEARIEFTDGADTDEKGGLLVVRMKDAAILTDNANFRSASPTYSWRLSELFPSQPKDRSRGKYQTTSEMATALAGPLEAEQRAEFRYEIQRRHALSATYVLFLLLGLPTGLVLRSSTQLAAFTAAVGYAFLYYVLAMRLGKVLAATGTIPPLLAAWATNALFLAAGLAACIRTLWR